MNDSTPAATLSVLLDGLIDYAGLFPPAKLDMNPMVRTYHEQMLAGTGWMVGRVVVPVPLLPEFEAAAQGLLPDEADADPWCISARPAPCGDPELAVDFQRIAAFNERHADTANGRALIDVIELPGASAEAIDSALDLMPDDLFPFVELDLNADIRGLLAVLAGSEAAAKVRTGGMRPELYPSIESLAGFITDCAAAGVPFKATAGMHHPLPSDNLAVGAREHGFLGVFLGACLAATQELDVGTLAEILRIDDPGQLEFTDDIARIGTHEITRDEIEEARLSFAISYGACSIAEPVEDLEALGLLPRSMTGMAP